MIPAIRYAAELLPGADRLGPTEATLVLSPDRDLRVTVFIGDAVETLTIPTDLFALPIEAVETPASLNRLGASLRLFVQEARGRHYCHDAPEIIRLEIVAPDDAGGGSSAAPVPVPRLELA